MALFVSMRFGVEIKLRKPQMQTMHIFPLAAYSMLR